MTGKQQPEALLPPDIFGCDPAIIRVDTATTQQLVQALRIQRAELETLRAKLKTYEDLGDAGGDVQLLRTGYAAARLEIESLKAQLASQQGPANATRPLVITSAPERIWLDLGFDLREEDAHFSNLHDLTWSADNATGDGIEYVRADLASRLQASAGAALPDEREAFEAWYIAQVRSKTSTTNDWSDDEIRGAWLSRPSDAYRSSFVGQSWEAWQARASHGQAPAQAAPATVAGPHVTDAMALAFHSALSDGAIGSDEVEDIKTGLRAALTAAPTTTAQAAPAYKDSTPELRIGDSAFESWYSTYSPAHKSDKQRARDAYAAGMGDPLVTAAPAAVAGPSDDETQKLPGIVDKALNELAGFVKFLETANSSWDSRTAKNALRDIEWFARRKLAAAPTAAAQENALDAARYRLVRRGQHWSVINGIGNGLRAEELDAAVDAARAAQEGK